MFEGVDEMNTNMYFEKKRKEKTVIIKDRKDNGKKKEGIKNINLTL